MNFSPSGNSLSTLNVAGSATLGGTLNIYDAVNVTSGTLSTGGNLILKSSYDKTARVGQGTGTTYISGDVTVERFIPQNVNRAWRMLSIPTKTTQTIKAAWQEGATSISSDPKPGYGTIITTGSTGGSGFDAVTLNPSMLTYNNGWVPVANTTDPISPSGNYKSGYMIYIRGNRLSVPSPVISFPTATTLETTGPLYMGTQTINVGNSSFEMVGNVFASQVDFQGFSFSNVNNNQFVVWDPKISGGVGGFITLSSVTGWTPSVSGSYSGSNNHYIESGQAFLVVPTGAGGTVTIPETAKTTGSKQVFRDPNQIVKLTSQLYSAGSAGSDAVDGNIVVFDGSYTNGVDGNDAMKVSNFAENFAVARTGSSLSVEARQPVMSADTIFFKMWNMKPKSYELRFEANNMDAGVTAYLEDKYLNTRTSVDLNTASVVPFVVNSTAASYAADRFRLVFKPSGALPVTFTNITATEANKKVAVDWKVASEQGVKQYEVQHSTDGRSFETIGTAAPRGNSNNIVSYTYLDENPATGSNYYRVKSVDYSGRAFYTSIVQVTIGKGGAGFSITPNPVTNHVMNVRLNNQQSGEYNLRLINSAGQVLYSSSLRHDGGSSNSTLILPKDIAPGVYTAQLISKGSKEKSIQQIMIER